MHLGIEPGSKAYRLYNPSTWRIVVSRDVLFDEKTNWSWNETTNGQSRDLGMFDMRWGEIEDAGEGPMVTITQNPDNAENNGDDDLEHEDDGDVDNNTQDNHNNEGEAVQGPQ